MPKNKSASTNTTKEIKKRTDSTQHIPNETGVNVSPTHAQNESIPASEIKLVNPSLELIPTFSQDIVESFEKKPEQKSVAETDAQVSLSDLPEVDHDIFDEEGSDEKTMPLYTTLHVPPPALNETSNESNEGPLNSTEKTPEHKESLDTQNKENKDELGEVKEENSQDASCVQIQRNTDPSLLEKICLLFEKNAFLREIAQIRRFEKEHRNAALFFWGLGLLTHWAYTRH